jgi:type II restriction/modification system DNA methylase subunit YeeA
MPLSVVDFVRKWKISSLSEVQGSHSHFIDLCAMLGAPNPAEDDPSGERYCFNRHLSKVYGGKGFADVWKRGFFAWEYKGKHKDLKAAYRQLNDYREDLGNPPLLVVCDLDRFEIHTNFENTSKRVYAFNLDDLNRNQVTASCPLPPLDVLRALFGDYNVLRPNRTDAFVTQEAAKLFAKLAERLEIEHQLTASKEQIAHFLMRLLFCLFADSIDLLPKHVFRRLIDSDDRFLPRRFLRKLTLLFQAMSEKDGIFGEHSIKWFNGGLFDSPAVIELDVNDLAILHQVATRYNWAHVAPAIFGTLFERSLDPKRRSLIGAHYTSEEDILLLIEPVVMRPLEQRWRETRDQILALLPTSETLETETQRSLNRRNKQAEDLLAGFFDYLSTIRILDPACGSGNFLYVALRRLLDLWNEARNFAVEHGVQLATNYAAEKMISPRQLYGIETEFYAHELASIVVWIGFLQWKHDHGVIEDREPILQKLSNIVHDDAILRYDAEGKPYEPEWQPAEFIVSNPPFLGDKKMRAELGDEYVTDLRNLYDGRVGGGSDLVTYWFEKARAQIEGVSTKRVGLLATNSISMVGNRLVLNRIKESGDIFMAWSDRPWTLEGAAVRVSMLGFDDGTDERRVLDGESVAEIHSDLTSDSNVASALPLEENAGICFLGMMKGGPFDITEDEARAMISRPLNPNGRPNSDVVKRRLGGQDVTGRDRRGWIIDFGVNMAASDAALYEWPFEYVKKHVKPLRDQNRRKRTQELWWIHGEARPGLRRALAGIDRCIVTPEVAKHRLFAWIPTSVIPDHKLHVFAREDDFFFGVLHSAIHETWTIATCSWIGKGNDPSYNSDSTFDTFPFPWPPGTEPSEAESRIVFAIAEAARELVRLRDAWLNPPGASEADLKSRTLTNLYNDRPEWLANAHRALDAAVFAAYGWPADLGKQEILSRLLALNHERARKQPAAVVRRKKSDSKPVIEEA